MQVRLLDLRPQTVKELEPLPQWIPADSETALTHARAWGPSDLIVTMCACPGDATANQVASDLQAAGFINTKALHGGFDAWLGNERSK